MNWHYSVLVLITSSHYVLCRPKHGLDEDILRTNQYYCHKLKSCKSNDKPVCGFDEAIPHLAVFGDLCILYKANCKEVGFYHLIDMVVCETRSSYDKEHANESFEYIHIITTLAPNTDTIVPNFDSVTGNVAGVRSENFAEFNCFKLKSCVSNGKSVCGVHPKTRVIAEFPDLCTFYGVNCYRQGMYQLSTNTDCKPDVVFLERVTDELGYFIDLYETRPPNYTTTVTTTRTVPAFWTLSTRWTIPPEFTTTAKPLRKGFSQYTVLDFISGLLDYLGRVL